MSPRKTTRSSSTTSTPHLLEPRRRGRRTGRLLAASVAAAACLGAVAVPASATGSSESVVSRGVTIPAFYDPPAQLPTADGTLVRAEPLPLGVSLPGLDGRRMPGTATRLMYKSTDAGGGPVAVTGAYIEPSAAWKGGGSRPLVALATGTMGQGDQCAPSLSLQHPLTIGEGTVSIGYDNIAVYRFLAAGAAVVVTDYAGLGATDRLHTYVDRVDEGHALLDAARAARSVDGASITSASKVGLYGYSQGGGASASAAELQSTYAPDVNLAGTYAGAPPADLTEVMKGIDGSALAGALGWSINGFAQSDPSLKAIVDANTNDVGKAALKDTSTMCVGDAILGYGFADSKKWTANGKSLADVIAAEPKLQAMLAQQRLGNLKPTAPVRLATGVQDDIVPHKQAKQLAVDWCRKGGDVTYEAVRLPDLGDKIMTNHLAPLLTDQGSAISWLTDRLSGKKAVSNCWSMPIQP
ncbi:lipase family protein [Streptomyces sp. HB132]|uniref:lipase family protein n=1 Tax=Streptomyces sp. HB132 TaxID=767388 RepID=UPI001960E3FE|nr:lipase family protein [Streptomyces sp. HB132]MBM7436823.1 dienelactone hydrolase [Streptomyces sp. HB132]